MPAYIFGVGYLIYTLFGIRSQRDGIGHTAHFGGAIGGIMCLVFDPFVFQKSLLTLGLLVIVTLVAGFILFRNKGFSQQAVLQSLHLTVLHEDFLQQCGHRGPNKGRWYCTNTKVVQ